MYIELHICFISCMPQFGFGFLLLLLLFICMLDSELKALLTVFGYFTTGLDQSLRKSLLYVRTTKEFCYLWHEQNSILSHFCQTFMVCPAVRFLSVYKSNICLRFRHSNGLMFNTHVKNTIGCSHFLKFLLTYYNFISYFLCVLS